MLTILRIVLTPIIIILGFTKHFYSMTILGGIAAMTDFLDGYLARKWNVISPTGAKLDTVADKVFAISLAGCLMREENILIIPFVLEIIIGSTNLYYHLHNKKVESLMIGKIKTCILFITVVCGIITIFWNQIHFIFYGFAYTTIHLQILCLIYYGIDYFFPKQKPSIEDNAMHKKIMEEQSKDIEQTIILENLEELAKEYNYNNEKDDIY